jgi:hypothetical protein
MKQKILKIASEDRQFRKKLIAALNQEVFWVGPPEGTQLPLIPVPKKPAEVWSLAGGRGNPDYKHSLPIYPVHGRNAFLEDIGHDWKYQNGKLKLSPSDRSGNYWILVRYE